MISPNSISTSFQYSNKGGHFSNQNPIASSTTSTYLSKEERGVNEHFSKTMADSDPDYVFPPNLKKKLTCSQRKFPPTLLVTGRKNIGVENDETTSAQGIDENEKPVNKMMTRSSSKNVYASIKSYENSVGVVNSMPRSNSMIKHVDNSFVQKGNGSSNKKRICRCNRCENCLKVNCKSCRACKDMRKYGGPGTLKLSCLMRPNCLNVFVPTLQKRDKMGGAFVKSMRKDRRHKKLMKVNDRYTNKVEVQETNGEEDIMGDEEIPPYKHRIFPLNDKDFEMMMSEQGTGGKDENFNLKKNIPTPNWVITEQKQRNIHKDTDDNDDMEMCKLRDASVKGHGDFKDFEDMSDSVFKLRHARAAVLDDDIKDESEEVRYIEDRNTILEVQETSIGL